MKDSSRRINLWGGILFGILTFVLLFFLKGDLLFRVQEQSLFVWDGTFFASFWQTPASLLSYLSLFFSQFCYLVWLGALLLMGFAFLIQYLFYKAIRLPQNYFLLALLPAVLLLLFVTRLDYSIYVMRSEGILFSQFIGFACSLGMLLLYRRCNKKAIKVLFLLIAAVTGYPTFGVFALFGVLLCLLDEGLNTARRSGWLVLLSLLLIVAVPLCFYHFVYDRTNLSLIYGAGLPLLDFTNNATWYFPLLGTAILCLLATLPFCKEPKTRKWMVYSIPVLMIILLFAGSYWNTNFHARLKMERAINANRWDDALEVAAKTKNPTRTQVMYKNLCLYKKGELLDKMFTYPDGSAKIENAPQGNFSQMSAPTIYFHYGLLNFCTRWAMEQSVQYGMSYENLRLLAKSALYRGEDALARKYLGLLDKTLFYSYLSERYTAYLDNPELMHKDGEYAAIMPLQSYEEYGLQEASFVESTVLSHYTQVPIANKQMLEMALGALLTMKNNGDAFWEKYAMYSRYNRILPMHILEATLLYTALENDTRGHMDMVRQVGGQGSPINLRYEDFMRLLQTMKERTPEMLQAFKEQFGDTYWYYYYFVEIN